MSTATKFLCVKNYSGKVIAEQVPYVTEYIDVTLQPNISPQSVSAPIKKAEFDVFSLLVPQP